MRMYHKKFSETDESQTLPSYEITESKETKSKNNSKKSMSVVVPVQGGVEGGMHTPLLN